MSSPGSYHHAARRAALAITTPERVFILSARYGLLRLTGTELLDPYELTIGEPGAITGAELKGTAGRPLSVARSTGPRSPRLPLVVLAGRRYADVILAAHPDALTPLAGTRGIGEQLHRLANPTTLI